MKESLRSSIGISRHTDESMARQEASRLLALGQVSENMRIPIAAKSKGDSEHTTDKHRIVVVTGGNKGIGLEISRQLASNGIMVILTARDEKRGLEAVKNLKACGLSHILFHRLKVSDQAKIASMADFIKNKFGKLDILVNNAGISGSIIDEEAQKRLSLVDIVSSNAKS
ncbi:(+)-neomenthol dehydrogenase-like [Camellia sinensis]|uniref:(+)-neomenthol dehydrogenase-like n=1 Tax=Camellia sinensis TaxID=4442 RepID=UPI00103684B2|nr:(+)-neomenthol dehydrogenase-like [Camellia sinensis]